VSFPQPPLSVTLAVKPQRSFRITLISDEALEGSRRGGAMTHRDSQYRRSRHEGAQAAAADDARRRINQCSVEIEEKRLT
jgi:hypothetical protein